MRRAWSAARRLRGRNCKRADTVTPDGRKQAVGHRSPAPLLSARPDCAADVVGVVGEQVVEDGKDRRSARRESSRKREREGNGDGVLPGRAAPAANRKSTAPGPLPAELCRRACSPLR